MDAYERRIARSQDGILRNPAGDLGIPLSAIFAD